jgi:hypothetical protein
MLDTITIPAFAFDLHGFIGAYRSFYRSWAGDEMNPDQSVPVMERFGDTPMPLYDERDLCNELTDRRWLLFFQMHEPLAGDTALCIDGTREPCGNFDIGVADGYGFLVEIHEGQISLHPALYDGSSGPFPTLDLQAHCSVLDERMEKFAHKWILPDQE